VEGAVAVVEGAGLAEAATLEAVAVAGV